MRFQFIEDHRGEFPIPLMCKVLEVSKSGYYAWRSRSESRHAREDRRLKYQIRIIFKQNRQTYGSPRVHDELRDSGIHCGRKRVARLMKEDGLVAKKGKQFRRTTISDPDRQNAENTLNRKFRVEAPDRVWAGDITYLKAGGTWLYLAVILDLFSRRVVGWATSTSLSKELALDALNQAIYHRSPDEGLLHHSDRGCQYTSIAYGEVLKKYGIEASMSRKGDCWDNAVVESFFATLKIELGDSFRSCRSARSALFDYIEVFYNRKRRHSSNGGVSPSVAEERFSMRKAA